jgi:hypothetical protein
MRLFGCSSVCKLLFAWQFVQFGFDHPVDLRDGYVVGAQALRAQRQDRQSCSRFLWITLLMTGQKFV